MTKLALATIAIALSLTGLAAYFGPGQGQATSPPHVVSALGIAQVEGRDVLVEVTVLVPPGMSERAATDAALRAQGARPFDSAGFDSQSFTVTGLVWNTLPVVQHYNDTDEPAGIDGQAALENTHTMWDGVASSSFDIEFGGLTNRCPSLVDECRGNQQLDGFNDVAFLGLKGPCNAVFGCTIGVTWSDPVSDEADIGLNTKVAWNDGCTDVAGSIDVQTVIGHENGHVAGLGHSGDPNALMFASYTGAQCALGDDDEAGLAALYPAGTPQPTATSTDTPVPTATPTPGGATATPTPDEGAFCPPGHQRRGIC